METKNVASNRACLVWTGIPPCPARTNTRFSILTDILSSSGPGIDEEEAEALFVTHDLVSSSESHNWSWIQQAMQGQIAKRLGKKAAEMEDERGTVLGIISKATLSTGEKL